jgi:membrane protein
VDLKARLIGPVTRRWAWAATAVKVQERFSEVHGSQLASAVTLAAFVSIFPLVVAGIAVVGFFSHSAADLPGRVIEQLGLTGQAADTVTSAIRSAERSRKAASVIGLAGLLWAGLALIAALEFVCDSVWQVTGRGIKDRLYGLVWLAGATVILLGSFALTALLPRLPGPAGPAVLVGALAVDVALWLWTFKVMTNRNVGWRAFLPGAILGAVGLEALKAIGGIYIPRAVASSSALYGSIGVVFATLAWLLFFGRLLVLAAVLNVVWWEEHQGTVTVDIEVPRVDDDVAVGVTRSGEETT